MDIINVFFQSQVQWVGSTVCIVRSTNTNLVLENHLYREFFSFIGDFTKTLMRTGQEARTVAVFVDTHVVRADKNSIVVLLNTRRYPLVPE